MVAINFDSLDWNKQAGLLPAIIQDANSQQVLMLGYMNREALAATQKDGLEQRQQSMPEGSYTTKLFQSGVRRIAQKVGEEGVETALAAVAQDEKDLLNEASDLVYHLMVLLRSRGLDWNGVQQNLKLRHQ